MSHSKLLPQILVLIFVLVVFIVAFNVIARPRLNTQLQKIPPIDTRNLGGNAQVRGKETISLDEIHSRYDQNSLSRTEQQSRNPFLWPKERIGPPLPPPPPPPLPRLPVIPELGMICMSPKKMVSLDNVLVPEGGKYGQHLVQSVSKDQVVLSGTYGRIRLSLPNKAFGAVRAEFFPRVPKALNQNQRQEYMARIQSVFGKDTNMESFVKVLEPMLQANN